MRKTGVPQALTGTGRPKSIELIACRVNSAATFEERTMTIEVAEGERVTITFDGHRCIHARRCASPDLMETR